ncbi:MAG: hypothetical protein ACR2N1_06925 [Rubripirellula sp.]
MNQAVSAWTQRFLRVAVRAVVGPAATALTELVGWLLQVTFLGAYSLS